MYRQRQIDFSSHINQILIKKCKQAEKEKRADEIKASQSWIGRFKSLIARLLWK